MGDILSAVIEANTKDEKRDIIIKNNTPSLRLYLRLAFDKSISIDVSDDLSSYVSKEYDIPVGMGDTSLLYESKKMYLFVKSETESPGILDQKKRDIRFIQLLESLDNVERDLLKKIKSKTLDIGLNVIDLDELIPGLIHHVSSNIKMEKEEVKDVVPPVDDTEPSSTPEAIMDDTPVVDDKKEEVISQPKKEPKAKKGRPPKKK